MGVDYYELIVIIAYDVNNAVIRKKEFEEGRYLGWSDDDDFERKLPENYSVVLYHNEWRIRNIDKYKDLLVEGVVKIVKYLSYDWRC